MGLADLVPGVSGGTIALISGIYEEFIESLHGLHPKLFRVLTKKGVVAFWKACNCAFLLSVFLGIISSIILFSSLIGQLLEFYPILLFSFFMGILVASIIVLRKRVSQWNSSNFGFLFVGFVISFLITQLTPSAGAIESEYFFLCGFIAISAMILPGLSGAYILLVMGAYSSILNLVKEAKNTLLDRGAYSGDEVLDIYGQLLLFTVGIVVGLLTFSRILQCLLMRYYNQTIAVLIGLMIGALHKIWPWQTKEVLILENKTKILYTAVWPSNFQRDSQWIWAHVLFVLGAGILLFLEKLKDRFNTDEKA